MDPWGGVLTEIRIYMLNTVDNARRVCMIFRWGLKTAKLKMSNFKTSNYIIWPSAKRPKKSKMDPFFASKRLISSKSPNFKITKLKTAKNLWLI